MDESSSGTGPSSASEPDAGRSQPSRARRWRRRGLTLLLWTVAGLTILQLMAWAHLDSAMAREAVRTKINDYVSGEMAGELDIGRVEHLHTDLIVAHDVVVRDPQGREVIRGETVRMAIDYGAAIHDGVLRFSWARLDGGELLLFNNEEGMPSFLDAFGAADPTPSTGEPFHAIVDDVVLQSVTVTGDLLGIEGWRIEDVYVEGDMEFYESTRISFDAVRGRVVAPYPFVATLEDAAGLVDTEPSVGTQFRFETHIDPDEHLDGTFSYRAPAGAAPDAPYVMDLQLALENLRAERLRQVDLEWAESLTGRLDGTVAFTGPSEDLALEAELESSGGRLFVRGRLPSEGEAEVDIESGSLRLTEVWREAPDITIDGRFRIRDGEEGTTFAGETEPFTFEGTRVPAAHLEGMLEDDRVRLDRAVLHLETGDVVASGHVTYEGRADLDVNANLARVEREPLVQSIFPDLAGRARFDGHLELNEDASHLDLHGRWVLTHVRYGPATVARLIATGSVEGPIDGPHVDLALDATDVTAFSAAMGSGSGRITGGPAQYTTSFVLARPGQRVAIRSATLTDQSAAMRVDVPQLEVTLADSHWKGSVDGLVLAEGGMALHDAVLRNGAQELRVSTGWSFAPGNESDRLQIRVKDVELALLRAMTSPASPELDGRFAGVLTVEGDFEGHPVLALEGHVSSLGYRDVRDLDGRIEATYQRGGLTATARLGSEQRGFLAVDLTGSFDTEAPLVDTYENGAYELQTRLENIDLTILEAFELPLPTLEGRAGGAFRASGTWDVFDFNGELASQAIRIDGMIPLGVAIKVGYQDGAIILRGRAADDDGELAELETSFLLDLTTAIQQPELIAEMLSLSPWRIAARIPPRDLGELPPRIRAMLPDLDEWRGSATLTIRGGAYRPRADLFADLEWMGTVKESFCGRDGVPRFTIRGSLAEGDGRVELHGLVRDRRVLYATATAPTPVTAWLAKPDDFSLPATRLEAYVENAPLEDVPFVCEVAAGPVTVALMVDQLFTPQPRAKIEVVGEEIHLRQLVVTGRGGRRRVEVANSTEPFALRVDSLLSRGTLTGDIEAHFWNQGTAFVHADVPLLLETPDAIIPSLDLDGNLVATAELGGAPLASVLFWLPSVGEVEGVVEGGIDAQGPLRAPRISGHLDVSHGHVELRSFGQRLDDVAGSLLLEGDRITLQNMRARDGDGTLRMAGDVSLDGIFPREVRIRLAADGFPVREEGSVMAALSGNAALSGELRQAGFEGELRVQSLMVRLPDDPGRDPITLSPHPDVHVVGLERVTPAGAPYTMHLRVDATRGFRMRGPDFAADLVADLDVTYRDPQLRVEGGVALSSGFFDVFGKRFAVERGWMAFDGGPTLDPQVNLVAVHPLRSRPGETVTVTAGGHLSNPTIQFSSTVTNDRAQIIALLVSGNVRQESEQEAGRQAADFLAGVAAGVLTLSLREEFGSFFPAIAVESNELGGARIASGVNFEELLPESIRRVVQGVYFEGFLNTNTQQGSSATGSPVGARLELDFPRGVSNTYTIGYPDWGVDVTWQP